MKKSSLLAAASAFAVISGFAAVPSVAGVLNCDNCNVAWNFDPGFIAIDADPIALDLDSLTRICANQTYVGEQFDLAAIGHVSALDVSNTASAIANVVSVSGGTPEGATQSDPSAFPAVVNAIQKANGELTAIAVAYDAKAWHGNFENVATAAANIANVSSTDVGVISGSQTAGTIGFFNYDPLELKSAAVASDVFVKTGTLDNTASSVANVASVSVSGDGLKSGFFDPTKDVVALIDLDQSALTNQSSFAMLTKAYAKGDVSNAASSVVNAVSATVETPNVTAGLWPSKTVGTVAIDVNQTAFSNLSAVSIAGKVASGGNFTNAATTAANVINVINK